MSVISQLEPKRVFYYFNELSKVPRESGNEKAISNRLKEIAEGLGLEVIQDEFLNVIIKKAATKGYENAPGVILQGHMDMVCEKENDSTHDFLKDPIELLVNGEYLTANKTTLGADNGIAVAMALAILEDNSLEHPAIEVLVTTCEEVDMDGALGLAPGILKGSYFINIDSEEEGVLTAGSAGGQNVKISLDTNYEDIDALESAKISILNLMGGHSGIEIDKKRGNSNKVLASILTKLKDKFNIKLIYVNGGSKDNAIPRHAEAIIAFDKGLKTDILKTFEIAKQEELDIYSSFEKELEIVFEEKGQATKVMSDKTLTNYISIINEVPTGVSSWMKEYPTIVESSDNLAIVNTIDDNITIDVSIRSSEPEILNALKDKISDIATKNNAKVELYSSYPEWRYRANSVLRDTALKTFKEMYNKDMETTVIHAGLECGAIFQSYPNLDMISIGPNMSDVHTPKERLNIVSTKRVFEYLVELLKNLK